MFNTRVQMQAWIWSCRVDAAHDSPISLVRAFAARMENRPPKGVLTQDTLGRGTTLSAATNSDLRTAGAKLLHGPGLPF